MIGNISIEFLSFMSALLINAIAFIVWIVKISGRVLYHGERLDSLETKHDALELRIVEELSQVNKSLARIEGAMSIKTERKR